MTKHTPGPWEVRQTADERINIAAADGLYLAGMYYTAHPENVIADATLAAAAPQMLAALIGVVNCPDYRDIDTHEMHAARAAIAAATPDA